MRNEIVVGLDDSPSSKAALDWAAEQARSVGAVLRAVHVLNWPHGLSPAGFPAPANFMDVSAEELQDPQRSPGDLLRCDPSRRERLATQPCLAAAASWPPTPGRPGLDLIHASPCDGGQVGG
jgi:Universal stress protein family